MRTIRISASAEYDIHIGGNLLSHTGEYVASLGSVQTVCIVTDSNVWPLYGEMLRSSLLSSGFQVNQFVFPAGEASKNASTYLELLNFLAEKQVTRTDLIVALGGGVVGDLAGFAAATYLRGIRYVQVPTTLLAAVDSSVGGKTAIDLDAGKNLAGAFYQPSLVLCDIQTLNSLPDEVFRDGCAEIIKYAVLYDPELFSLLEEYTVSFDREDVIARCIRWKRDVVMADERDTGARRMLNLGHTAGHGIEAVSNYTVSHGAAVAIGMAIVSRAFRCKDTQRIENLLQQFGLAHRCEYDPTSVIACMASDKKRHGDAVALIIPGSIGDCRIENIPVSKLESILMTGF